LASLSIKELIDLVGFVDPASGKTSVLGCQNAIAIVGQDEEGRAFVLDEYAERTSSDTLNLEVFRLNKMWLCKRFGVEASAQQYLYYEAILREANMRRERIQLIPIEQPTNQTKEWRITTTIQEWMHNGMLFVDRRCIGLKKQLEVYPNGQLCDLVDALASALRMLRSPFASRMRLSYDDRYDDDARWREKVRRDRRYEPFSR
jgi:predicted phage terminase large subunit-like protein